MMLIPIGIQVECAEADLVMYKKAMPDLVKSGKYSQAYMDAKVATQAAIVHTLRMMLPPKGVTQGSLPVVLHFETEADRAAYVSEVEKGRKA